jgi:hypothetical protein
MTKRVADVLVDTLHAAEVQNFDQIRVGDLVVVRSCPSHCACCVNGDFVRAPVATLPNAA